MNFKFSDQRQPWETELASAEERTLTIIVGLLKVTTQRDAILRVWSHFSSVPELWNEHRLHVCEVYRYNISIRGGALIFCFCCCCCCCCWWWWWVRAARVFKSRVYRTDIFFNKLGSWERILDKVSVFGAVFFFFFFFQNCRQLGLKCRIFRKRKTEGIRTNTRGKKVGLWSGGGAWKMGVVKAAHTHIPLTCECPWV